MDFNFENVSNDEHFFPSLEFFVESSSTEMNIEEYESENKTTSNTSDKNPKINQENEKFINNSENENDYNNNICSKKNNNDENVQDFNININRFNKNQKRGQNRMINIKMMGRKKK